MSVPFEIGLRLGERRKRGGKKSLSGADTGDVFMTLVHTTELSGVNPFDYLTELLRHARHAQDDTDLWMPWNYRRALKQIS